jgi:hypothetical protein
MMCPFCFKDYTGKPDLDRHLALDHWHCKQVTEAPVKTRTKPAKAIEMPLESNDWGRR